MNTLVRLFEKGEVDKIIKITQEGGVLYLIERTDTNEFCCVEPLAMTLSHEPLPKVTWKHKIGIFIGTQIFLTEENAEEYNKDFTEGGCQCCGHGSKKILTVVSEHEYLNKH